MVAKAVKKLFGTPVDEMLEEEKAANEGEGVTPEESEAASQGLSPSQVIQTTNGLTQTPLNINATDATGATGLQQAPIIRSGDTGAISGINIRGKTFLGLPFREIRAAAEKAYPSTPLGLLEAQQQARAQEASRGLGQLTPEQAELARAQAQGNTNAGFNQGQAATAALTQGLTGAGVGFIAGGGPTPTGFASAVIGFAGGMIRGYVSNLAEQQTGTVKAVYSNLPDAEQELNDLISAVNAGLDPIEARNYYNQVVYRATVAHEELKLRTQGSAGAFDDGTKQLEQFETFFDPNDGILNIYNVRFNQAAGNPNPNLVSASFIRKYGPDDGVQ